MQSCCVRWSAPSVMLSLPASIRIFVSRDAVDFRKAHDGLLAVIRDAFGDDPFDGSLFVFLLGERSKPASQEHLKTSQS